MKKVLLTTLFGLSVVFGKGVVVLNPASVEIFYMLKCEDKIAAIAKTQSSEIWPKDKTDKLLSVGTYMKPNLEKIVALSPSMVITSFGSSSIIPDLDRLKIKHEEMPSDSLEDIYKSISMVGAMCHKEEAASKLLASYKQRLASLSKDKLTNKKAVFFYATANLMAFGKGTLPDDIFKTLGVKNLADNLSGKTPIITPEFLIEQNPDFMVIAGASSVKSFLSEHPLLANTKAAKNNKIFVVSQSAMLRGSPRIVDEIEKLHGEFIK
ncbi:hemin ABC transporter substrate-binding protein [Helicobacter sp. 13S00401-1]|uniref:ABC transporter substrate-binding protein n=1 Tax=Helicobacter sp. 13S00401-1 TaxID=1905758 RepID=UPI000BA77A49|nr:ABC transporter substrate-binding protein [Helicobacter sp. 13S00401-1]PAF50363.1 hemin ABC transporter substrate-binding protein [Helicobacter sp. 13S00401-1]